MGKIRKGDVITVGMVVGAIGGIVGIGYIYLSATLPRPSATIVEIGCDSNVAGNYIVQATNTGNDLFSYVITVGGYVVAMGDLNYGSPVDFWHGSVAPDTLVEVSGKGFQSRTPFKSTYVTPSGACVVS